MKVITRESSGCYKDTEPVEQGKLIAYKIHIAYEPMYYLMVIHYIHIDVIFI